MAMINLGNIVGLSTTVGAAFTAMWFLIDHFRREDVRDFKVIDGISTVSWGGVGMLAGSNLIGWDTFAATALFIEVVRFLTRRHRVLSQHLVWREIDASTVINDCLPQYEQALVEADVDRIRSRQEETTRIIKLVLRRGEN